MKALTLHACWAWAIAHAGKDVENRIWSPPKAAIGTRIAIHAGANPGSAESRADCDKACRAAGVQPPGEWPRGVILCTALLAGVDEDGECESVWYGGPYGWLLRDIHVLPVPVPCKGMLGLWDVAKVLPDLRLE
jgi:hypothetical protein